MSYTIELSNISVDRVVLEFQEFSLPHTNNYTRFRAKYKGSTLTIFKTNTMIIQGSDCQKVYEELCNLLNMEPVFKEQTNSEISISTNHIGTDEVGTGDFFGGIVVAAAFVPEEKMKIVRDLGVKDSKNISNSKIEEIAPKIMNEVPFSVVLLDNIKFNFLTKVHNMNMNKIKALLHNSAIKNLIPKLEESYEEIIIDGFTTQDKYFDYLSTEKDIIKEKIRLVEKGESKYISVAVASIIARYTYLMSMNKLSKEVGFDLPKGAGKQVDKAISKLLKEQSERYLDKIAKTSFRNLTKTKKESQ